MRKNRPLMTSSYPKFSDAKTVFSCPWFQVHEEYWEGSSSLEHKPFYRIDSSDGVLVLALTKDGDIILVRQFRHAIRKVTLEFPAGFVDSRESPEQAAARELFEETGYRASGWVYLASGHLMVNRFGSKGHLFLAQGCQLDVSATSQTNEAPVTVSPDELKHLVLTGEFEHIPSLSLLSFAEWKTGLRLVA